MPARKLTSTNAENEARLRRDCPFTYTQSMIGGRWKQPLLWVLGRRPHRPAEMRRLLPGCAPKMLTQHLRELMADGLIARSALPAKTPHVEYALTALGQSLLPVLQPMWDWGVAHLPRPAAAEAA